MNAPANASRERRRRWAAYLDLHDDHDVVITVAGWLFCVDCRNGHDDIDEIAVDRAVAGDPPVGMSPAETGTAVGILTARGLSAREIGRRLHCSPRTVARHRARARRRAAA